MNQKQLAALDTLNQSVKEMANHLTNNLTEIAKALDLIVDEETAPTPISAREDLPPHAQEFLERVDAAITPESEPLYAREFPDFWLGDDINIPEGWEETSWHNDICPSWEIPGSPRVRVWVDYLDHTMSETGCTGPDEEYQRFHVDVYLDDDEGELQNIYDTAEWGEVLWLVESISSYNKMDYAVVVIANAQARSSYVRVLSYRKGQAPEWYELKERLALNPHQSVISYKVVPST